jgi:hypothetical protein
MMRARRFDQPTSRVGAILALVTALMCLAIVQLEAKWSLVKPCDPDARPFQCIVFHAA